MSDLHVDAAYSLFPSLPPCTCYSHVCSQRHLPTQGILRMPVYLELSPPVEHDHFCLEAELSTPAAHTLLAIPQAGGGEGGGKKALTMIGDGVLQYNSGSE